MLAVLFWGCLLLGMPESRGQEAEWRKGTYPDGTLRYEGYFRAGKPAEPLKNTQQATVVAEKSKCHNRPAKPKLVREPQQKQSADKTEQASSRSAKLRSRYENYE